MPSLAKKDINRIASFISSERFFWLIVIFFVLEAVWIALSGRYPMAFDEDFHFGVIRLYAHHISPFWSDHPSGADAFGAVARDPSYLYQWLMSFPYRLISAITASQSAQVIFLRFINIVLLASSLPLYRKLLLRSGASRAIVNFCLALFVLIPIAPLLAAQINYDNLFIPMVALTLLLTVDFSRSLKPGGRLDGKLLLALISAGLLTSLVKYAFLPVLFTIAVYLVIRLKQVYGSPARFWAALKTGMVALSRRARWSLGLLLVVAVVLSTQRYGINTVRYHTPVPACDDVLSEQQCEAYSPWSRDHYLAETKNTRAVSNSPLVFTADWFYGMWMRSFFAVDGPRTNFQTRGPLILPGIGAIFFSVTALAASLLVIRQTWRRYGGRVLWLFVTTAAVYTAALWADGLRSFLETGAAVAINGRYLLPIMPILLLLLALGVNTFLEGRERLKLVLAALALLSMLWGGGTLTYILRSNNSWYWNNQTVRFTNKTVRNTLGPITPGYYLPNEFMGRN